MDTIKREIIPGRSADSDYKENARAVLEEEVILAMVRIVSVMQDRARVVFQSCALTPAQYNVLRILHVRGGEAGLPAMRIGDLLVQRVPDISRLLNRMERDNLVQRRVCTSDRRRTFVSATQEGNRRRAQCDTLIVAFNQEMLRRVPEAQQNQLLSLLQSVETQVAQ